MALAKTSKNLSLTCPPPLGIGAEGVDTEGGGFAEGEDVAAAVVLDLTSFLEGGGVAGAFGSSTMKTPFNLLKKSLMLENDKL
jgi:hypothetical protein